ncbi:MAG TPA: hypothetical protein VGK72_09555, partial [Chthoniobacterales bacterium]
MTALFTVGVILLILGFAATLGAALLRPAEKARISAAISSVAHNLNSSDPRIIAQLPLRLTVWFLDRFLGKRSFSLRRLGRSVVFGALLFGFSLGLSTLRSGNLPFPVEDAPWHTFDRAFGAIEASAKTIAENPKQTPETRARLAKAINKVKSLRNAENRSTYSVIYFPLLVLVCSVFMSLSFSIARCLLIEMGTANHLVSLLALGVLCVLMIPCWYFCTFTAIHFITSPVIVLTVVELANFGHSFSITVSLIMTLLLVIIGLLSANTWLKVLVSTLVIPLTASSCVWVCALILFVVKKPLHWSLSQF